MSDSFIYFCSFIGFSFLTILYLGIPISEIVIGVFYHDLLNINNDIINFNKWLKIVGLISINPLSTISKFTNR